MIYILSIIFTLSFVYYTKWQFVDERGGEAGKWHPLGMVMRLLMFVTPFAMQYFPASWQDYLLSGAINVFLWDILINKIALGVDWFYIGATSELDKKQGSRKWFIYFMLIAVSLLLKLMF